MMTKREGNILLLTFAITTIIWCVIWAYAIGKISRNYENEIFKLETKNYYYLKKINK
jgi:ATP/ADP translocase